MSEQADPYAFVSIASHELRTPLASLQTTLELLKAELIIGATSLDQATTQADRALRQTRRVVRLANDLLDLSRLDGEAPLMLEPIELSELVGTIHREFLPRLRADCRALLVEGAPAVALADATAAARVLRVLFDNATAYGAGTIGVELWRDDERVFMAVADQGPGVAPDERERIFGRFVRGHAATRKVVGAGLGLTIARGLARAMGGDLEAAPVRRGARFVFTVPAVMCP